MSEVVIVGSITRVECYAIRFQCLERVAYLVHSGTHIFTRIWNRGEEAVSGRMFGREGGAVFIDLAGYFDSGGALDDLRSWGCDGKDARGDGLVLREGCV